MRALTRLACCSAGDKVLNTGVVYLYRFAEGEVPAHNFLHSYKRHPAGVAHDLHVIFKGFPNRGAVDSARALFGSVPISAIEVDDTGYDIGSYIAAARTVVNPQLLFFNTFSEILADNWLEHFDKALALPGVGLVGATGSWQSARSGYEAAFLRMLRQPQWSLSRYSGRAVAGNGGNQDERDNPVNARRLFQRVGRASLYPIRMFQFKRHPNPHIRTNAFMVRRDTFLSLRGIVFKEKMDAYKFESGRDSMTRQIIAFGLRPVVIDRRGQIYEIPEWKSSSTFWIDVQANLLVADNQTNNYAVSGSKRRRVLKNYAWDGPRDWDPLGPT